MKQNQVNESPNPTTETDGSPRPAPKGSALQWQPIETAPKDGRAVLLLGVPYELDAGPNGIHQIPAKVAIGCWWAEGTSWVQDGPRNQPTYDLQQTGVWLSGGGWFQPNEISHWMPLPDPPSVNVPERETETAT